MKKKLTILLAALFFITASAGCSSKNEETPSTHNGNHGTFNTQGEEQANEIVLSEEITELANGLSAVRHTGDYGFDEFLAEGGASSDAEVVSFLMESDIADFGNLMFGGNPFGCSALSVKNADGDSLFGRNFDWNTCNAMVIQSRPENGYSSISTVNTDFIGMSGISISALPDGLQALAGLYAPLDGLNEMVVTKTPAVTNFYLAEGEKNGIGTRESHERYKLLMNRLKDTETMEMNDVRDTLDSVSKENFGEFESTEWSIVMNQSTGEVWYYHRENYTEPYVFTVTGEQEL